MIIKKFDSFNKLNISVIRSDEVDDVVDLLGQSFGHIDSNSEIKRKLYNRITNGLSIRAKIDNKIVGVYLVAEKSAKKFLEDVLDGRLDSHKNAKIFISKNLISDNGIQGIALCVDKDYRGLGIGNKLKSYFNNLKYDYIWGVQDKRLNNINHWTKSRVIFMEDDNYYCTIKFLK